LHNTVPQEYVLLLTKPSGEEETITPGLIEDGPSNALDINELITEADPFVPYQIQAKSKARAYRDSEYGAVREFIVSSVDGSVLPAISSYDVFNPTGDGTDLGRDGIILLENIVLSGGSIEPDGFFVQTSTTSDFSEDTVGYFAPFRNEQDNITNLIVIDTSAMNEFTGEDLLEPGEAAEIFIKIRTVRIGSVSGDESTKSSVFANNIVMLPASHPPDDFFLTQVGNQPDVSVNIINVTGLHNAEALEYAIELRKPSGEVEVFAVNNTAADPDIISLLGLISEADSVMPYMVSMKSRTRGYRDSEVSENLEFFVDTLSSTLPEIAGFDVVNPIGFIDMDLEEYGDGIILIENITLEPGDTPDLLVALVSTDSSFSGDVNSYFVTLDDHQSGGIPIVIDIDAENIFTGTKLIDEGEKGIGYIKIRTERSGFLPGRWSDDANNASPIALVEENVFNVNMLLPPDISLIENFSVPIPSLEVTLIDPPNPEFTIVPEDYIVEFIRPSGSTDIFPTTFSSFERNDSNTLTEISPDPYTINIKSLARGFRDSNFGTGETFIFNP
ncbi:hypothetical protein IID04_05190, partial [PVC group bacterium]|nr:hypothetical protein [PVC group bacterium]